MLSTRCWILQNYLIVLYKIIFPILPIFTRVKMGSASFPLTPVKAFLPVDTGNPEKDFHSCVYILDKYSACYQYRPLVGLMLCR